VLDNVDGSSSLAAYLSTVVELLEGQIDAVAANGVCWGTWSVLVAALSHFLKLESELVVLGSERNVDLKEDQAYALWTRVHVASDSLSSHVPPQWPVLLTFCFVSKEDLDEWKQVIHVIQTQFPLIIPSLF
jgi:hypothetical protein